MVSPSGERIFLWLMSSRLVTLLIGIPRCALGSGMGWVGSAALMLAPETAPRWLLILVSLTLDGIKRAAMHIKHSESKTGQEFVRVLSLQWVDIEGATRTHVKVCACVCGGGGGPDTG